MIKFIVLTIIMALPWMGGGNVRELTETSLPVQAGGPASVRDVIEGKKFYKLPVAASNAVETLPISNFYPVRNWSHEDVEIDAKSAVAVLNKSDKVLFRKNIETELPVASLVKILTAMAVIENLDLKTETVVSEEALATTGNQGKLKMGETLSAQDLLFIMLIESSNDAAAVLEELFNNTQKFSLVETMNRIAFRIGMKSSNFVNPTGLDAPDQYSTADDLLKLIRTSFDRDLIWHILGLREFTVTSKGGYTHTLENTNKLLAAYTEMVGGKTGYTDLARGNFLTVLEAPSGKDKIIMVILGSEDRFGDSRKLISWIYRAYEW